MLKVRVDLISFHFVSRIGSSPLKPRRLGQQDPVVRKATGHDVRADPGGRILQGRPVGMPPLGDPPEHGSYDLKEHCMHLAKLKF